MAHGKSGAHAGAASRRAGSRRVLFICAANTARSIIAEHLLRRELHARGAADSIEIRSAGIAPYARDGALVSLDTRMTLKSVGIDIGEEAASTDLKRHPEMLEEADLVLAMTVAQERDLRERFPGAASCAVFTLRSFAGEAGDIDDPFEQGHEVFDLCRDEIGRLVLRVADRLLGDEWRRLAEQLEGIELTGFSNPPDAAIREILAHPATVAVMGCSDNPARDSLRIAMLLKRKGFRVIPVNPKLAPDALMGALGERCYPDLASIPGAVQMVDVFRRSEHVAEIAAAAIAKGAGVLWCQLGVVDVGAAARARAAGMTVVMDRCPAIEYGRLF